MRKKRRVAFFLIMVGVFAVLALPLGLSYALGDMPSASFVVGISVASALWLACTIAGIVLISRHREGKWDECKSCKNGGMVAAATIGGIFGFWWVIGGIVGLIFAFVIDANVSSSAVSMDIGLSVSFFAAAALLLGIFGAALAARGEEQAACGVLLRRQKAAARRAAALFLRHSEQGTANLPRRPQSVPRLPQKTAQSGI